MSGAAKAATEQGSQVAAPPFEPDVELIDHLEGNERAIKRYRAAATKLRDDARQNGGKSLG